MTLNFQRTRDYLKQFDFETLFVEELGWSRPARKSPLRIAVQDHPFTVEHVAQLAGAVVPEKQQHRIPPGSPSTALRLQQAHGTQASEWPSRGGPRAPRYAGGTRLIRRISDARRLCDTGANSIKNQNE
jgi:hypothetical protein